MRNTLITIAAWTAAIAIVLWQRFIWPGLKSFLPGIEELFSAPASGKSAPVRTTSVQEPVQAVETLVIERCKPAAPRRSSRKKPAQTAGFAA